MTRYFHLYADEKRIREISLDKYMEIRRKDRESRYSKTVMWVGTDYIGIGKGEDYVTIPLRQLLEVLKICGVIKDEG